MTLDEIPEPDVIVVPGGGASTLRQLALGRRGATYVPQLWVEVGRYLTGAGVSAGIDAAFRLAAILTNDDLAHAAQLGVE